MNGQITHTWLLNLILEKKSSWAELVRRPILLLSYPCTSPVKFWVTGPFGGEEQTQTGPTSASPGKKNNETMFKIKKCVTISPKARWPSGCTFDPWGWRSQVRLPTPPTRIFFTPLIWAPYQWRVPLVRFGGSLCDMSDVPLVAGLACQVAVGVCQVNDDKQLFRVTRSRRVGPKQDT